MMNAETGYRVAKKATVAYTGLFAVGSFLSIKRDYPAEALGMKTGWSAKRGVLSGMQGAGLAAPWNLIVQLWVAVTMAGAPGRKGRRGKAWLAFLASMLLAGSVAEPVSHKIVTRELPLPDATVALANIIVPILMLGGALVALVEAADDSSANPGISLGSGDGRE